MRVFECSSGNPFQQSLCFFVPLGGLRKALVKRVYAINDRVYRERKRKPYRWVAPQKKKKVGRTRSTIASTGGWRDRRPYRHLFRLSPCQFIERGSCSLRLVFVVEIDLAEFQEHVFQLLVVLLFIHGGLLGSERLEFRFQAVPGEALIRGKEAFLLGSDEGDLAERNPSGVVSPSGCLISRSPRNQSAGVPTESPLSSMSACSEASRPSSS